METKNILGLIVLTSILGILIMPAVLGAGAGQKGDYCTTNGDCGTGLWCAGGVCAGGLSGFLEGKLGGWGFVFEVLLLGFLMVMIFLVGMRAAFKNANLFNRNEKILTWTAVALAVAATYGMRMNDFLWGIWEVVYGFGLPGIAITVIAIFGLMVLYSILGGFESAKAIWHRQRAKKFEGKADAYIGERKAKIAEKALETNSEIITDLLGYSTKITRYQVRIVKQMGEIGDKITDIQGKINSGDHADARSAIAALDTRLEEISNDVDTLFRAQGSIIVERLTREIKEADLPTDDLKRTHRMVKARASELLRSADAARKKMDKARKLSGALNTAIVKKKFDKAKDLVETLIDYWGETEKSYNDATNRANALRREVSDHRGLVTKIRDAVVQQERELSEAREKVREYEGEIAKLKREAKVMIDAGEIVGAIKVLTRVNSMCDEFIRTDNKLFEWAEKQKDVVAAKCTRKRINVYQKLKEQIAEEIKDLKEGNIPTLEPM